MSDEQRLTQFLEDEKGAGNMIFQKCGADTSMTAANGRVRPTPLFALALVNRRFAGFFKENVCFLTARIGDVRIATWMYPFESVVVHKVLL